MGSSSSFHVDVVTDALRRQTGHRLHTFWSFVFGATLCKALAKERIPLCSPCARSCGRARLEKKQFGARSRHLLISSRLMESPSSLLQALCDFSLGEIHVLEVVLGSICALQDNCVRRLQKTKSAWTEKLKHWKVRKLYVKRTSTQQVAEQFVFYSTLNKEEDSQSLDAQALAAYAIEKHDSLDTLVDGPQRIH